MPSIDPNLTMLAIAVFNAITALIAWDTRRSTKANERVIGELEKNTNSIKDALVKVTGEAAHAAGREQGRAEGETKAAALAEGKLG